MLRTSFGLLIVVLVGCGQADQPTNSATTPEIVKDTVAVIGTGDMGDSFGPRLASLGYRVVYGSRNPASEKVKALVALTGHGATATTQQDAAQQADVILLAIPWPAMETVAQNLGDLSGKVVIDMSWPPVEYAEDGYEKITIETSAAELIQGWNPEALVVKAFLNIGSFVIDDPDLANGPVSIPIASDHRIAKEKTAQIAADLEFDPVDVGPLRFARNIESLTEMILVPGAQGRNEFWILHFRRSIHYNCNAYEGDGSDWDPPPVIDADNLAVFPRTEPPLEPCSN